MNTNASLARRMRRLHRRREPEPVGKRSKQRNGLSQLTVVHRFLRSAFLIDCTSREAEGSPKARAIVPPRRCNRPPILEMARRPGTIAAGDAMHTTADLGVSGTGRPSLGVRASARLGEEQQTHQLKRKTLLYWNKHNVNDGIRTGSTIEFAARIFSALRAARRERLPFGVAMLKSVTYALVYSKSISDLFTW